MSTKCKKSLKNTFRKRKTRMIQDKTKTTIYIEIISLYNIYEIMYETKEMEKMKKKLISSLLAISILSSYLPIFTNIEIIPTSEAATPQTVWEYNFTGSEQTLPKIVMCS